METPKTPTYDESLKPLTDAEEIDQADDLAPIRVDIPEWKGFVWVRALPAGDAIKFTEEMKGPASKNAIARIAILSVVKGEHDLTPVWQPNDLEKVKKKGLKALGRIQTAALIHNGLQKEEVQKKEDAAKND